MPENPLNTVMKIDPKLVEHMRSEDAWAYDAAHGAANGVRSLAQQAIQAGTTKEEIGEALRVAYVLSGIGSVYVASQSLKELFP